MTKEIQALKCIAFNMQMLGIDFNKELNIIHQALTTKSKKELAFDIIRKKNINVYGFITTLKANKGNLTYKQYKGIYGAFHNGFDVKLLTEEEFELLKSEVGK